MTKPLEKTAKIIVLKQGNPFREGTAVHRRARAVLTAHNKTVEYSLKKGAKTSTVRWLLVGRYVSVKSSAAKKKAAA